MELPSDIVTISNQKIGEGTFGAVSIGHIKTLDFFVQLREKTFSSF